MRTLTSARVYLAWGQCSIRFGRVLFTIGRTAAAFSDNPMVKPSALHLPFGPVLPGYVPRIICLFRSPHTSSPPEPFPACVSPASRHRVSTGMSMQPGTYFWRDREEKQEKLCFRAVLSVAPCTCIGLSTISRLHPSASKVSWVNVYIRVYKHGRERRNAQKSRKVRETVSTMPFALPISGSYISQDNGINS